MISSSRMVGTMSPCKLHIFWCLCSDDFMQRSTRNLFTTTSMIAFGEEDNVFHGKKLAPMQLEVFVAIHPYTLHALLSFRHLSVVLLSCCGEATKTRASKTANINHNGHFLPSGSGNFFLSGFWSMRCLDCMPTCPISCAIRCNSGDYFTREIENGAVFDTSWSCTHPQRKQRKANMQYH